MMVLLDTNVVVAFLRRGHLRHVAATSAVKRFSTDNHELCLVPQVCYEFWVVATRPLSSNGLGLQREEALRELVKVQELFSLMRDERTVFDIWQSILGNQVVMGKQGHDARLVAAMQRHGITHLLTFNIADFRRYSSVELLNPNALAEI